VVAQIDPASNTVVARYGGPRRRGCGAEPSRAVYQLSTVDTIWRVPIG